jgi:hypothetical protein
MGHDYINASSRNEHYYFILLQRARALVEYQALISATQAIYFQVQQRRRLSDSTSSALSRHPKEAVTLLEESFSRCNTLTPEEKERLSQETGLTSKQLLTWYVFNRIAEHNGYRL